MTISLLIDILYAQIRNIGKNTMHKMVAWYVYKTMQSATTDKIINLTTTVVSSK